MDSVEFAGGMDTPAGGDYLVVKMDTGEAINLRIDTGCETLGTKDVWMFKNFLECAVAVRKEAAIAAA